ncbi:hypothetical protein CHS0354_022440 [Potamilus streckersoni]|uniref:DNA topoisomerase (ATP-hydrolyzing) n=1 Tax=Potamilus streckersoni TaxID=2493646 RepID=A0AAE0SY22_9BIVA|nr:hypothetical protein CHS0354_022440 [Potamilus streckersoni]
MEPHSANNMWSSLKSLKARLVLEMKVLDCGQNKQIQHLTEDDHRTIKEKTLMKIENVVEQVLADVAQGISPSFVYGSTSSWSDVSFVAGKGLTINGTKTTSVRFESFQSVRKFGLLMKVLSVMYKLVQTDKYCTKRDIFYQDTSFYGTQSILDGIVDNISCMLEIPRWHLHVLATLKGCIAGNLTFQDAEDNLVDCQNTQMGKGFPDMNTRLLLHKLWNNFQIPVLGLVDADPHGIEIMATYKFGSRSLAFEAQHLSVPCMQWLGILPTDIQRLGIPESVLTPMTKTDISKAVYLLDRPYMKYYPAWTREIEELLKTQKKAEIQSLDCISSSFLCDVYLPSKIRCGGWI